MLATAAEIGTANAGGIDLWDIATGNRLAQVRQSDQNSEILDVALSADAKILYTAGKDKVAAWELKTGKQLRCFVPRAADQGDKVGSPSDIQGEIFSPDAQRLFVSQGDWMIVWDVASGKVISKIRPLGADKGGCVGIFRDGRSLSWGEIDPDSGSTKICTINESGAMKIVRRDPAWADRAKNTGDGSAASFALSPDGKRLYTAMDAGDVLVWNLSAEAAAGRR